MPPRVPCSAVIDGRPCLRSVKTGGFCATHYYQDRNRPGTPFTLPQPSSLDGFWSLVEKDPSGCWLWAGPLTAQSYAVFSYEGEASGHRVAYRMVVGSIPVGMDLDHLCHNADLLCVGGVDCLHRRCVNPAHLEPVTRAENTRRIHERRMRQQKAGVC